MAETVIKVENLSKQFMPECSQKCIPLLEKRKKLREKEGVPVRVFASCSFECSVSSSEKKERQLSTKIKKYYLPN